MKRLFMVFFVVVILLPFSVNAQLFGKKEYRYVKVKSLNVREDPSSKGKLVGKLEYLEKVQVDKKVNNDKWWKIKSPLNGYVSARYLITKQQKDKLVDKVEEEEDNKSPSGSASTKTTGEVGLTAVYWLGGSARFGPKEFMTDVEKEPGFILKFSYDSVSTSGNAVGFFFVYAPDVTFTFTDPDVRDALIYYGESTSQSTTLMEYGVSLKTLFTSTETMDVKLGFYLGFRTYEPSNTDIKTIEAMGLNVGLQFKPRDKDAKHFFEAGIMAQPNGGNDQVSFTFGPILYISVGVSPQG